MNPNVYDVKIGESTGASSAAPTYFDPKKTENAYGLTELQVDGGIICNNPSLYAYQVAKLLNKKKKKLSVNFRKFVNYLRTRYFNKKNY